MTGPAEVRYAREGSLARVTLNRPGKRNALDQSLVGGLGTALRRAEEEPDCRVVLLDAAGRDFCAGIDLAALHRLAEGAVEANLADAHLLAELFLTIRRLRIPVVAVVQGRALGGGCGLATACDVVLAAEDAVFGYPEVRIGFVPAVVMTMLRRNVSEKRAFEALALGETIGAVEAERIGMINRVYPAGELAAAAEAFAAALAERSPSAVELCKRLFYQQDGVGFEAAIRSGADVNVLARMTEDTRAGIARFVEDRRSGEEEPRSASRE